MRAVGHKEEELFIDKDWRYAGDIREVCPSSVGIVEHHQVFLFKIDGSDGCLDG